MTTTPKAIEIRKQQIQNVFSNPDNLNRLLPYFNNDKSKAEKFKQTLAMIAMSDKFKDVEPLSIFKCGISCAELALNPQPSLGQAYFVTYNNKLEFTIGTKGYITLLERANKACKSYLVYDCDKFNFSINGFDETFEFQPNFDQRKESDPKWIDAHLKGCLVLIKNLTTGILTTTFVPVEKLKSLRAKSPSLRGKYPQYSPWNTSPAEMFMTKGIRYVISKTSLDNENIAKAMSYDAENEIESEMTQPTNLIDEDGEARIELMDLITKGNVDQMETMKSFISSHTNGKQLKDLDYDECHKIMNLWNESIIDVKSKDAEKIEQSEDNYDPEVQQELL